MTDAVSGSIPVSGTTPLPAGSNSSSSISSSSGATLAGNFQTFLTLLTTQLQNQNPLDPLDTNQFTQQLVQFASVEQQMNMNTQLQTLVALQQTAQNSQALGFVGKTVTVNGSTAPLTNGKAQWTFNPPSPATATFTVTDSTGQTVYTKTGTVQPGTQAFNWNGLDNSGRQWADGNYTLTITAVGADSKPVAIATNVTG